LATTEQRELGHERVGTEHLLLALLADERGRSAELLTEAGASLSAARHMVAEVAVSRSTGAGAGVGLSPRAQRALDRAGRFARQDRAAEISEEHVLLGVLDVEGLACQVLRRLGVDLSRLRSAITGDDDHIVEKAPPETTDDADDGLDRTDDDARPVCGVCRAPLDDTLAISTVAATSGVLASLHIVHCRRCGAAIGVLPP
jgi:ATP-dependent Clp protease ATP-binding subunit ClpA